MHTEHFLYSFTKAASAPEMFTESDTHIYVNFISHTVVGVI